MSKSMGKSISIIFRTPAGDTTPLHERQLTGVPKSKAAKMAEDFAKHRESETEISPHQLYRYEDEQGERLVALDFTEVVGIFV